MVTHSVPEAVTMSDRVIVLSNRPARLIEDVPVAAPHPRTPEDVDTGACEFEGAGGEAGSDGLEFCAPTAALPTSQQTKSKMRINIVFTALFYRSPWVARNACRHLRAVSNSENRLPSCSIR